MRAGLCISGGGGGGDFTGRAGWFPRPQVIHFTFLSGVLAAHPATRSNCMSTKQTGEAGHGVFESPVEPSSLQAIAKLPGPGAGERKQRAGGAGKPRGEGLLAQRDAK